MLPTTEKTHPEGSTKGTALLRVIRRNKAKYIAAEVFNCFTYLFIGGALWQGLLLHIGCSADKIGALSGIGYTAQTIAMGAGLLLCDKLKKPVRAMAFCDIPIIVFFFTVFVFLCSGQMSGKVVFPVLVSLVIVYYAAFGFKTILAYKVPYLIIDMDDYGKLLGGAGFVSNLFCIAVSSVLPIFLDKAGYMTGMRLMYIVCTLFALVVTVLDFHLKSVGNVGEWTSVRFRELITEKNVLRLAPANFLRGLSSGVMLSITIMASGLFSLDSVGLSLLVSLTSFGSVIGNFIYSIVGKASRLSCLCLISSVFMLVFGPISAVIDSWSGFMVVFIIIQTAYVIVNGTIPVLFAKLIPYRVAGGCTALRMMETMLGTAISSWFTGYMLERFAGRFMVFLMMLAAGAAQTICGLVYYRYCRISDRGMEE